MANLPDKNADYARLDYWNDRYTHEEIFEWCKSYSSFKHLIDEHVKRSDKILMLGCGNSELSEEMYRDGYHSITNIDYSPVVIENMKNRSPEAQSMQWMIMDVQELRFDAGQFDVVIEKATLDALLVNEKDPWHISDDGKTLMNRVLTQVSNVLLKGGRFISITFAQPHFRKRLYAEKSFDWNIHVQTFGYGFHFFFYVMTKGEPLSASDMPLELSPQPQQPVAFIEDETPENYLSSIEF